MIDKSDVCIVGGGVVGLFSALLLARSGRSVCVIDKTYAASSRYNIGEVAPSAADTALNPLIKLSQEVWLETPGVSSDVHLGVKMRSRLEFCEQDDVLNVLREEIETENENGIPTSLLELERLQERVNEDSPSDYVKLGSKIVGAKYIPEEPVIATKTCLERLKAAVIQAGVKVWGTDEVAEFILDGNKIAGVKTLTGDECHAAHTIITAGVFVSELLSKLDTKLPIRPARCHILHVTPNDDVPNALIIHRSRFGHIYMKTNRNGRMMLTYDGLGDSQQATYEIAPNPATVMWLQAEAARMLPALANARIQEQTTVLLSVTPDYLPCIGQLPNYENLHLAIGMGGRSFALAAGVAECLLNTIRGKETSIDLAPFDPSRFMEDTWKKARLPGNLAATSSYLLSPPPTIKMVEKHIQTMNAHMMYKQGADIEQAENVHMTEKRIQSGGGDAIINQEVSGDIEQASNVHMTGDKNIQVAGEVGFKESSGKATVGKLGG